MYKMTRRKKIYSLQRKGYVEGKKRGKGKDCEGKK